MQWRLTSDSPADQRRSMSVKERGEARARRGAVVRRRRRRRVVRVVVAVGKCIVAVLVGWTGLWEAESVLASMRLSVRGVGLVLRVR